MGKNDEETLDLRDEQHSEDETAMASDPHTRRYPIDRDAVSVVREVAEAVREAARTDEVREVAEQELEREDHAIPA